jgi:hypothetical protein
MAQPAQFLYKKHGEIHFKKQTAFLSLAQNMLMKLMPGRLWPSLQTLD